MGILEIEHDGFFCLSCTILHQLSGQVAVVRGGFLNAARAQQDTLQCFPLPTTLQIQENIASIEKPAVYK